MPPLPAVHLTTGLPASGKSTFARTLVEAHPGRVRRVNMDDLRMMMDYNDGSQRRPDTEDAILAVQDAAIIAAVNAGQDIIVDNTHLAARLPNRYKRLVSGRAHFVIHDFTHVSVDECIRRDAARDRTVGEKVIRDMHERMTKSKWRLSQHPMNDVPNAAPYTPTGFLPHAIICDIDGTLAYHIARGPYDFERVETDALNREVARILEICKHANEDGRHDTIILLSGRQSEYRAHTERWLAAHNITYDALWMRAEGDRRPDDVVKAELFDNHVRGRYDVRFVLDDRNRVVDLWRRMGLQCWQVAPGDF